MRRIPFHIVRTAACIGLIATSLQARAATIVAGPGANPPASATGIYEIAVATTNTGRVQKALALVHKGTLKEIHSRSSAGYQRREAGSTPIRVPTTSYARLLTLAGGSNRDVNAMSLASRCQFYTLAGIPTTGMGCPTSTPMSPTLSPTNGTCPTGYELKFVVVNGSKQLKCVLMTRVPRLQELEEVFAAAESAVPNPRRSVVEWLEKLIPVSTAEARLLQLEFKQTMFGGPIAFSYFSPEASETDYGGWRFEGFGFTIIWANDGP